jgi:four helix bundle protein
MAVRSYRELTVWRKAMDLVKAIYDGTRSWPKEELYGLTSQIRRAVVSVPSNIAEGQGRSSTKEFLNHLSIAYGSLMEVETQIVIAQEQGYYPVEQAEALLNLAAEVGRLLNGLSNAIAKKTRPPTTGHRSLPSDH